VDNIEKFFKENVGMIIGGLIAFVLILFVLEVGVVKSLIIIIAVICGIIAGKRFLTYDKIKSFLKGK